MEPIPRALQVAVALIVLGLFVGFAIWYADSDARSQDDERSGVGATAQMTNGPTFP